MVIEHTVVIQGADMQMQQMLWYLIVEMGHASNEHTYMHTPQHYNTSNDLQESFSPQCPEVWPFSPSPQCPRCSHRCSSSCQRSEWQPSLPGCWTQGNLARVHKCSPCLEADRCVMLQLWRACHHTTSQSHPQFSKDTLSHSRNGKGSIQNWQNEMLTYSYWWNYA